MDTFFTLSGSFFPANTGDLIGVTLGAILTLCVFSYLLVDNFLFRLAQAIFVGAAIGYGATIVLYQVVVNGLIAPLVTTPEDDWPLLVPLVLGVLLLFKLRAAWGWLGNVSIAYLLGVGAALALGGALSGVLVPQLAATIVSLAPGRDSVGWANNLLIVVGTLGAFLSFRFTGSVESAPNRAWTVLTSAWGRVGRGFIYVAFGALFAGIAMARISALVGQVYYLLHNWLGVVR
jgi:hypothetical protein